MKTKTWVIILSAVALALAAICVWQLVFPVRSGTAEILVDGVLVQTVDLSEDQRFTVECENGCNVIVVEAGKISVAASDCRGNDCVHAGARNGGIPIICLPHRLVIRFPNGSDVDGIVQ